MNPFKAFQRPVAAVTEFMANFERANPKRAQRALWGGKNINYGNAVSFSNSKTRRTWKPNVQTKRLFSEAFDTSLKLRVTTYVLRCIDKAGGLDNYLTQTPDAQLASELGSRLKADLIEQKRRIQAGEPLLPLPREAK